MQITLRLIIIFVCFDYFVNCSADPPASWIPGRYHYYDLTSQLMGITSGCGLS